MKLPTITLLLLSTLAHPVAAQRESPFSRGSRLGGLSLNSNASVVESETMTTTVSTGNLNIQFGYFLTNGLVLGLDLASSSALLERETPNSTQTFESTNGTFGLFTAYYFRIGSRSALYPELRLYGGEATDKGPNGKDVTEFNGSTIGVGYSYLVRPNIGLDVKLRAGGQTSKDKASSAEQEAGVASLLLGFQIYF